MGQLGFLYRSYTLGYVLRKYVMLLLIDVYVLYLEMNTLGSPDAGAGVDCELLLYVVRMLGWWWLWIAALGSLDAGAGGDC